MFQKRFENQPTAHPQRGIAVHPGLGGSSNNRRRAAPAGPSELHNLNSRLAAPVIRSSRQVSSRGYRGERSVTRSLQRGEKPPRVHRSAQLMFSHKRRRQMRGYIIASRRYYREEGVAENVVTQLAGGLSFRGICGLDTCGNYTLW